MGRWKGNKIGWIDKHGKLHEALTTVMNDISEERPTRSVHLYIARKLFPNAENPGLACEKAGYVKFGRIDGKKQVMNTDNMTQAQINKVDKLLEEE